MLIEIRGITALRCGWSRKRDTGCDMSVYLAPKFVNSNINREGVCARKGFRFGMFDLRSRAELFEYFGRPDC